MLVKSCDLFTLISDVSFIWHILNQFNYLSYQQLCESIKHKAIILEGVYPNPSRFSTKNSLFDVIYKSTFKLGKCSCDQKMRVTNWRSILTLQSIKLWFKNAFYSLQSLTKWYIICNSKLPNHITFRAGNKLGEKMPRDMGVHCIYKICLYQMNNLWCKCITFYMTMLYHNNGGGQVKIIYLDENLSDPYTTPNERLLTLSP